ncbi:tetratricopeptide repeat protein [Aliikangiella sp. G2MR2-5]|uniref:tetratricopeptide repeat protein n=1 Tax=Aliikangiella sp. G2MR2-5 TaxID=2788943 RepID=UPI0018A8DD91|nr:tetratricopeptide repeat protein [Aliikangiella sp. G2MR2-5]
MKFNFSRLKWLPLFSGFVLLTSCSSMKPGESDSSSAPDQQVTANNQNEAAQDSAQPRIKAKDPMNGITAPLSLIKIYAEVNTLLENKNFDKAVEALKKAQVDHPESSGPGYRLARVYMVQGRNDLALDSVETALSIKPDNYVALNLKAILLKENGEFDKSLSAYQKALEVYPDYLAGHLNLAILADIYLYQPELALKHFETYLMLKSETEEPEDKKVTGWVADLKRRLQ